MPLVDSLSWSSLVQSPTLLLFKADLLILGVDSDEEAARSAGAQGYLVKPVLNSLVTEVDRLIEASR
jgi:hypothetical protein